MDPKGDQYLATDIVSGSVPTDINGVYMRNGPNPNNVPENGRYHWFDGDGMLCAIRLHNG